MPVAPGVTGSEERGIIGRHSQFAKQAFQAAFVQVFGYGLQGKWRLRRIAAQVQLVGRQAAGQGFDQGLEKALVLPGELIGLAREAFVVVLPLGEIEVALLLLRDVTTGVELELGVAQPGPMPFRVLPGVYDLVYRYVCSCWKRSRSSISWRICWKMALRSCR